MDDLAILFIYTNKCPLTGVNLESIQKHSDGAKVYPIHQNDFPNNFYDFLDFRHISQWNGDDIWYWGSDNIFLYWYLSNPDKRAKQYLILEYDFYATQSIRDSLGIDNNMIQNYNGIASPYTMFAKNHGTSYWWFEAQKHHPLINELYGWANFAACSPLCCNMLSDDAVQAIVKHLKEDSSISNKLYVETKFATILGYLKNFKIESFNNGLKNIEQYISYSPEICLDIIIKNFDKKSIPKGIFHPIKDIKILEKYFMKHFKYNKKDIHKVLFGQMHDVTSSLNFMKDKLKVKSLVVDNLMFGDPSPGFHKELYLTYTKNGQIHHKVIQEDETLIFEEL